MDASSSTRQRLNEDEDRISYLPDNILHYILSFLSTKFAVRTSVLSTRWKQVWFGISNLVFYAFGPMDKLIFMNFVDNVLLHHDATFIDKFSVSSKLVLDDTRVNGWISTILDRNVGELVLNTFVEHPLMLPCTLFTSKVLQRMKLHVDSNLKLPVSFCISSLKVLHLDFITFSCEEEIHQVSLSFPVLEKLVLIDCIWNIEVVNIYAPALENLMINDASYAADNIYDFEIKIYAESLITLDLVSKFAYKFSLHNLSSLSKASVDFHSEHGIEDRVSKLIEGIGNAKDLMLSSEAVEILFVANLTVELLAFPNLKSLRVHIQGGYVYGEMLTELFSYLPNVESLLFTKEVDIIFFEGNGCWTLEAIPQSFLSNLKSVELRSFDGNENDLGLVEFLLKNAIALQKVTIRGSSALSANPKKQFEVTKQLLMLPRDSTCVIDFS
ncbi:hypothetical protein IFM89_001035 [Coptis chinensis]|uniref:F-box domain-containing protein n=1 Tax=Coptis chinensis TaxID=261450 RepID=A0A835GTG8_9MAGN|nr:hypothetical protein IFM89_001035 [Coptis chinensis]